MRTDAVLTDQDDFITKYPRQEQCRIPVLGPDFLAVTQAQTDDARFLGRSKNHAIPDDHRRGGRPAFIELRGLQRFVLRLGFALRIQILVTVRPQDSVSTAIDGHKPSNRGRTDKDAITDGHRRTQPLTPHIHADFGLRMGNQLRPARLARRRIQGLQPNLAVLLCDDKQVTAIDDRCPKKEGPGQRQFKRIIQTRPPDFPQAPAGFQVVCRKTINPQRTPQRISLRQVLTPVLPGLQIGHDRQILDHKQSLPVGTQQTVIRIAKEQVR